MTELTGGEAVRLVLTTLPDEEAAARVARTLVEERLAACGNILPGARSIYRWRGAVEDAGECLLLLKVPADGVGRLAARLRALHPYEVPEILVLAVERGSPDYLAWVVEETEGPA